MKSASVTIPDDLAEALAAYGRDMGLDADVEAAVSSALREVLIDRGYTLPFRPVRITPLHREKGPTAVSINHDDDFADGETRGPR